MLFQEKAGFEITAPETKKNAAQSDPDDEDIYQHLLMGEQYGVMKGKPRQT
jgi:phosphatidylserine decarboxylase